MKLNRACIADPSHSPPLLSDRLLACLSIQLRALPCSVPSISIRNTPNLPLLTESGLNDPRHSAPSLPHLAVAIRTRPHLNAPRLPDLYFPCINLLLAVLTHLACWASRNPDVTHPSMPAMPHPPVPVIRHRIAPLPPARTFLSASLVACHHKPCPTQTLPVNLHPPFRACYPFLVGPLPDITCHSHPRLLIRAFSSLISRHLPLRATPCLRYIFKRFQISRNLVQQIVLSQVFLLQFLLAYQLLQSN